MTVRAIGLTAAVILAMSVGATALPAGVPAKEGAARTAIARGLNYAAVGSDWWIEKKGCPSCHHLPFLLWTHNAAVRAGLSIDGNRLSSWTNWSLAAMLATDGGGAGGVDTIYQVLLGRDLNSAWRGKPPLHGKTTDPYETLWLWLIRQQKSDGSWVPGGQLKSPPEVSTAWAILALDAYGTNDRAAGIDPKEFSPPFAEMVREIGASLPKARRRALEWLASRPTVPGNEARMLQLLVAKNQAAPDWKSQLEDLKARQNADGGWAYLDEVKTSNPFATGQVMWALRQAGIEPTDSAMTRARDWLLRTQQADGSWAIRTSEIHPADPERALATDVIYRYWGSAWATIGLLQTLPAPRHATAKP